MFRVGETPNDRFNEKQLHDEREFHRRKTGEFLEAYNLSIPCQYYPPSPPDPVKMAEIDKSIKDINKTMAKYSKAFHNEVNKYYRH